MTVAVDALADGVVEFERIVAAAVGDAVDAGHQAHAAYFADQRQVFQRLQPLLEIRCHSAGMSEDSIFQQIEVAGVRGKVKGYTLGPSFDSNPLAPVSKE